jgi:thiol:disulfide interchange protein/DsbC/DsbD-like thiol-disulfide interchange protein
MRRVIAALVPLALAVGVASGQVAAAQAAAPGVVRVDAIEAELVAAQTAVRAGGSIDIGLRIRHDDEWHTYWRNPGDSGLATQLTLIGPPGTEFGPIRWPAPYRIFVGPLANYGYEGEILLPLRAMLPAALPQGPVRLEAHAQWLVCREVCIPGEARLSLVLPVAETAEPSRHAALFDAMARRTPDPAKPLEAKAFHDARMLSLVFAAPQGAASVGAAEFFPYAEGVIDAPAPQVLKRVDGGWRLDLRIADGADLRLPMSGLLLADGRPLELQAAAASGVAPDGAQVSIAQAPVPRASGGLLQGLPGWGGQPAASRPGSAFQAPAPDVPGGLLLMLGFGVLGGLILNLMPCVFPVVGLKVLGFAGVAQGTRSEVRWSSRSSAMLFALGVLVSFWALAALMIGLRMAGESIGWGFQLQSPLFVASMALLFVAIGLNFSGVYEFGAGLTRLGALGDRSPVGAFATGVLAVLVATPCTAPFMGSALGYTLGRPAIDTWLVFSAIGIGMALPYLLLGWFPQWLRWLPKPGRWMESFKQALAFPMYATAAWLAWVLAQQTGADGVLRLLIAAVLVAMTAWLYGRFVSSPSAPGRRGAAFVALLSLGALVWLVLPLGDALPRPGAAAQLPGAGGGARWQAWSEERVADALSQGRPVFVDFTAAWCVTCQANKKLVLDRDPVVAEFERLGVVAMRADWTQRDPAITAALARYGRNGVPLYVVHLPGRDGPRVLPELLTAGIVIAALR